MAQLGLKLKQSDSRACWLNVNGVIEFLCRGSEKKRETSVKGKCENKTVLALVSAN